MTYPKGQYIVWSPIEPQLASRCEKEGGIRLIIAPFIQRDAFRHLLDELHSHFELKVITRWNAPDLASGVSDPFVFEECRDRHVSLYLHPGIHLKLITMGSGLCFCGSANITASGLGLNGNGNIEAGTWTFINPEDWRHVYDIINCSLLVDNAVFESAVAYCEKSLYNAPTLPALEYPHSPTNELTLTSLPATKKPEDLIAFAAGDEKEKCSDEDINRLIHDIVHFGVPWKGDKNAFIGGMGERFITNVFVSDVINLIHSSGKLRFGEMSAWIHSRCRDVPVPFRWEVKEATKALYNWLSFFVPEISWSVPGKRSQVIIWKEPFDDWHEK